MTFARPVAAVGKTEQNPTDVPTVEWRGDLLWAVLGTLIVFLMRWPFIHLPLNNNEGELINNARPLQSGALLYCDHCANHTPLAYYWFLPLAWLNSADLE